MTIIQRVIITLSVALLGLIAVGSGGLAQLARSQARFERVEADTIPSIQDLDTAKGYLADLRLAAYRLAVFSNSPDKSALDEAVATANRQLDDTLTHYKQADVSDDTDMRMAQADEAAIASYRTTLQPFIEHAHAGDLDGIRASLAAGAPLALAAAAVKTRIDEHIAYNMKAAADVRDQNASAYRIAFWTMLAVTLGALLLSAVMATRLVAVIRSSLNGIRSTLERVSESLDLTLRAPVARMDEIGRTGTAFNALIVRIADVMTSVRTATESVGLAAKEIAAGNIDLSARTEQQAASLEQSASSMQQLTATVKNNADNARQASSLAATASEVAQRGNLVVGRVVDTMSDINGSSTRIADITGIIEGIAFQTNILALNAAVEAARAGEQGRGFAVVASEVRSLAQRSSTAAKEIKDLIADSVQQVRSGSTLVEDAGRTMTDVMQAVQRVTDIMGEIASASDEQSRGLEQVNQAITQMDEVTQQNAALVEESAAAAQALESQGDRLRDTVGVFKVAASAGFATGTVARVASAQNAATRSAPVAKTATKAAPKATTPPRKDSTRDAHRPSVSEVKPAATKPASSHAAPAAKTATVDESADWETF
ncbi:methyl-accepting chemotaxis protein [Paraburkholderia sp.]|uniref:methyl-accepting chemotaxis protein n=1 Tax=Paraburkholderia sp. TaxID=1926495 RepID=UPI002392FE00|nr:methyl-accepting chemotaxis protein [Paraburkholderia sp.]MDE1180163.1 methyl-accepting chemotaxis protein [Paraburkholderia sp.]